MDNLKPLVAVLWDVENVAPEQTGFIIEKINEDYRLSHAIAFADWTQPKAKNKCEEFSKHNFEMIHTPHIKGVKNTADISMVTHGLNILYHYPNITHYLLLTGDADFRPLLMELRKAGKIIKIICDAKNASIDLISMADDYIDYRDIIKDTIPEENDDDQDEDEKNSLLLEDAYKLLEDAVVALQKESNSDSVNSGSVKTKMKLLNSAFDEKNYGFTWKKFIKEAEKKRNIRLAKGNNSKLTYIGKDANKIPEAFQILIESIKKLQKNGKNEYCLFNEVAKKVKAKSSNFYGYNRFKNLAVDAEKRGFVETYFEEKTWFIKLIDK